MLEFSGGGCGGVVCIRSRPEASKATLEESSAACCCHRDGLGCRYREEGGQKGKGSGGVQDIQRLLGCHGPCANSQLHVPEPVDQATFREEVDVQMPRQSRQQGHQDEGWQVCSHSARICRGLVEGHPIAIP